MLRSILFFLVSVPSICIAQEQLSGTVRSIDSKESIAFANIVPVGRQGGTYSDENGAFEIIVTDRDSLSFSSVGYKRITLSVADIKKLNGHIHLHPETILLEGTTITAKKGRVKTETKKFGYLKANWRHTISSAVPGSQFAVFVKNDSRREGLIEFLLLGIVADKKSRIRVRLYEPIRNGVGNEITKQNIFADVTGNHKALKIDISKHQIPFPEKGIVVAVEFLGEIDKDGKVKKGIISKLYPHPTTRLYFTHGKDAERNTWTSNRDRHFVRESYSDYRQSNINIVMGLSAVFFEED